MKSTEEKLGTGIKDDDGEDLPPVRGASVTMTTSGTVKQSKEEKKDKKMKPREYREWDK